MVVHAVITGATGFVARHVRRHLHDDGVLLYSISRRDFRNLKHEKKIVTAHYEPGAILPKIKKCNALIHLVGIGNRSTRGDFHSVNFELTKKIISLCKRSGIKKIIYLSGLGVSKNSPLEYFASKYRAEDEIRLSGLDFTIFRPSYIVGKDDLLTKHLKRQIRQGEIIIPGSGKFHIQPISISDVSKVVAMSLAGRFPNRTLDLVGPELMTFEGYVRKFPKPASTKIRKISLEKAYRDAINRHNNSFEVDDLNLLVGNFHGNFEKLKDATKIEFQPVSALLQAGILP